jgi:hypothetical protein
MAIRRAGVDITASRPEVALSEAESASLLASSFGNGLKTYLWTLLRRLEGLASVSKR